MNTIRPEEIIGIIAIVMVWVLPTVWVVAHYSYLAWKQWQATALVRDMVSRGYTAQEIIQMCQVLGHKKLPDLKAITDVPPAKPIKQPAMLSV